MILRLNPDRPVVAKRKSRFIGEKQKNQNTALKKERLPQVWLKVL